MQTQYLPAGFRKVGRRDNLFQEQVHDTYKSTGKLAEPTVCTQCHAIYEHGRWHWGTAPTDAKPAICPACHRIHDHYPAGFLTLGGAFFRSHHDEILRLVRNHEARERAEHPLQRIMAVEEEQDGEAVVTTTDIHLARGLGEALHHAYQGELEYHYNPSENLLRVHWSH